MKLTVAACELLAGIFTVNGESENGDAGAVQLSVAATAFGLVNVIAATDGPPPIKPASATVAPEAGEAVSGSNVPAGQLNVQLTGTAVPPRFSVHDNVCVCTAAPSVQLPDSGPPLIAPAPTAVTVCPKPANGAVGATQLSDVVSAAVDPEDPGVATEGVMVRVPELPIVVPPAAVTVVPVAGA